MLTTDNFQAYDLYCFGNGANFVRFVINQVVMNMFLVIDLIQRCIYKIILNSNHETAIIFFPKYFLRFKEFFAFKTVLYSLFNVIPSLHYISLLSKHCNEKIDAIITQPTMMSINLYTKLHIAIYFSETKQDLK